MPNYTRKRKPYIVRLIRLWFLLFWYYLLFPIQYDHFPESKKP